jgi:hypothetical protein
MESSKFGIPTGTSEAERLGTLLTKRLFRSILLEDASLEPFAMSHDAAKNDAPAL